jgi:simple sugar transport system permease protein
MNKLTAKFSGNNFLLLITIVLFVSMYIIGMIVFADKNFGRMQVFLNLFISNAGLIVAAAGMTMVMITGGIDISVGSVIGLTCMMLAYMMERMDVPAWQAILIVLLFGVVFGLAQGWLIAYLKIQPFIVTLAGLFFARGLTAVISADMISITNPDFLAIANAKMVFPFGGYENKRGDVILPYIFPGVIMALLVVVVVYIILRKTRFGRDIYAVGGNEQSAMLMGLNVRRTKLLVYMFNGFLSTFAGFMFGLNSCGGFVEQARGFEIEAISSAVIGGTLLTGGVGNVFGSLIGVLIKGTIETFITSAGTLSSWWTRIVIAALLCFFIVLQSIFANMRAKKL